MQKLVSMIKGFNEISSLQRRLLAMNDIADGRASEYKGKEDRLKRFKK